VATGRIDMTHFRLLLPLCLLAACGTHSAIEQSRNYARLGDYLHAYEVLETARSEQAADGGQVDAQLAAAHRTARMEFLLDRARQRIFQERAEAALVDLDELASMDPEYPGMTVLRERANHKRAVRAALRGEELLLRKEYAESLAFFLAADKIEPGLPEAREGIEKVRQATTALSVRAQQEFLEAVRKLPEFRFIEVQWHSGNVIFNEPSREDASVLRQKALRKNAEASIAAGRECETAQQFGAALTHYREAQRVDRGLPGIDDLVIQMEREVEAQALVDRAQKELRAAEFDTAREYLGKAFELSVLARNDIGALVLDSKKMEAEARYQKACDLATLGKKGEALAAFDALIKDWPEGLSDEVARRDGLRVDIEGASKAWVEAEAAEAAGDLRLALQHYETAERYYAGWKEDGKARVARLREAVAKLPPPVEPVAPPAPATDGAVAPASETPAPAPEVPPASETSGATETPAPAGTPPAGGGTPPAGNGGASTGG
jgi:TolA-binding protein